MTAPSGGRRGRPPRNPADEVCTLLLRALRHAADRGPLSSDDVVCIARVQLMRPGSPAHCSPEEGRARLFDTLERLGRQIEGPPTPRALYGFARAAAEASIKLLKMPRHPGVQITERLDDVRGLAEAALWAVATQSRDSEDMVRRAVLRAVRERKRRGGLVRLRMEEGDPLRAMLDLPRTGKVLLARNDVRAKMSQASEGSAFGSVLRKAARFSEEVVRPMVGEDLWELGRPVGFSDQAETRVVIEVSSSVRAQEIQLRSTELVERLRAIPGFSHTRAVHILLKNSSALPVVGARRRPAHLRDE